MFLGKIAIKSRMTPLNTFMPPNRFLHKKKMSMKKLLREKKLREKAKVSVPIIERSEDLACLVSGLVFNSGKGC